MLCLCLHGIALLGGVQGKYKKSLYVRDSPNIDSLPLVG